MQFASVIDIQTDGNLQNTTSATSIQKAKEIVLKISAATNYNFTKGGLTQNDVLQKANDYLQKATISFNKAIIESQKAYQVLF